MFERILLSPYFLPVIFALGFGVLIARDILT